MHHPFKFGKDRTITKHLVQDFISCYTTKSFFIRLGPDMGPDPIPQPYAYTECIS